MINKLINMGFTKYEAKAYITLLENGALNGYELSKLSGIPKANAYSSLQNMLEKGFVYKVEEESSQFVPRAFKEIVAIIKKQMDSDMDYLLKHLPSTKKKTNQFLTIQGQKNIVDKIKLMVDSSQDKVLLDIWDVDLDMILEELLAAKDRGVKIYLIVVGDLKRKLEFEYIYKHPLIKEEDIPKTRDMNMICDNHEAISAQVGTDYCNGIYSQNNNFTNVVAEALAHDILLHEALAGCSEEHVGQLARLEKQLF